MASLLDKSLLRTVEGIDGQTRFTMLETIREYALERLEASGEQDMLRRQHAAYSLALAEGAEPQIQGAEQAAWLDRLETEHDNLRAALSWAITSGAAAIGLRLAAALGEFWWPRGHVSEGRRWLAAALASKGPATAAVRAKALYRAGELSYAQGDYGSAAALLEESLGLYRDLEDKWGMACVLRGLGNTLEYRGDPKLAEPLRQESLELFREIGDPWGIAWMLYHMASERRDIEPKIALLEESLALARAGGYKRLIVTVLNNLGMLAREQGDTMRAVALYNESLELCHELHNTFVSAWVLHGLGIVASDQGAEAQVRALFEESLALHQEVGNRVGVAVALNHLGDLALWQDDYAQAAILYDESLIISREVGDIQHIALVLRNQSYLALHQGNHAQAVALFQQSLALFQEMKEQHGIARCLEGMASLAGASGQPERAARLWGAAEVLRESVIVAHGRPSLAERAAYDRSVDAARAQIDPAIFTAAWAEGRAISLEQAIAEATAPIRKVEQPIRKVEQPIRKVATAALALPDAEQEMARAVAGQTSGIGYEIPEALWEQIVPLLPPPLPKKKAGRPRMDDRKAMAAIYSVLQMGGHWKALPRALGAPSTVHGRYQEWRAAGLFERMRQAGMLTEEALQRLDSVWHALDVR
jgi:transposase/tetratricopeptide (TPR) repeat protein